MTTVQEKAMCVLWNWELKSIILVQRRYRMQYGKDPPTHQSIRHWCWQFQAKNLKTKKLFKKLKNTKN